MNIERVKEMPELKKEIFRLIAADTANVPNDDAWRAYERDVTVTGGHYTISLSFRKSAEYFTYRNFRIEHKQETKELWQPKSLY